MADAVCPLCQTSKHMRKKMLLYNVPVCRKCYYRLANRRHLAYILDLLFMYVLFLVAGIAIGVILFIAGFTEEQVETAALVLGWAVFLPLFLCKDGFAGRSPGKFICGVMVVDKRTHEPTWFGRSFVRNLPLIIPFVPLIIALLLQRGYRWGDGWAGTKVVWTKYANHPLFTGRMACEMCKYDLTANTTGVCPECGIAVPVGREPTVM